MPRLYEYLGIAIWFFSDEHHPIHVHARYGDNEVKVELYEDNGIVYDVQYREISGKFSAAKMRDLKMFINENKSAILFAWKQVFEQNVRIKPIKITKKIR
jgi:hypothetical protein